MDKKLLKSDDPLKFFIEYATGWTWLLCRLRRNVSFACSCHVLSLSKKPFASGTIMHLNQICINLLTQSLGRNEHLSLCRLLFCQRVQLHFLITRRGKKKEAKWGNGERANVRRAGSFVLGEAFCARPREIYIRTYVAKHTQSVPNYYTHTYIHTNAQCWESTEKEWAMDAREQEM